MWFRRRRRPEQLDLSALDGLAELVGRIVALLPEQRAAQQPQPSPEPIRARIPAPLPPPGLPEATARTESAEPAAEQAALLFVATASGYRLLEAGGVAAARGERVELADGSFRVLRLARKSTRLDSSHLVISYAVFCLRNKSTCDPGQSSR